MQVQRPGTENTRYDLLDESVDQADRDIYEEWDALRGDSDDDEIFAMNYKSNISHMYYKHKDTTQEKNSQIWKLLKEQNERKVQACQCEIMLNDIYSDTKWWKIGL